MALGRLYGQGIAGLIPHARDSRGHARTITEAFDNAYPDLGKLRYRIEDNFSRMGFPAGRTPWGGISAWTRR